MFALPQSQLRLQLLHAASIPMSLQSTIATCYSPHSGCVLRLWNFKSPLDPLLFLSSSLHFKCRWVNVRTRSPSPVMLTRNWIDHWFISCHIKFFLEELADIILWFSFAL